MIRVLIVDDSAFMRKAISMMLESDPEFKVIDTARDGLEAIEKVRLHKPDVVTMDVEMPRMDGITALKQIMKETPVPVLMVSSITKEGAQATVEALQAGAVDFIPKQLSYVSLEITKIKEELIEKIKSIASSRSRLFRRFGTSPAARRITSATPEPVAEVRLSHARAVAIGVSTGGPFALQKVIPLLPGNLTVPVVVVQHMPPHFTKSLADRLNSMSPLTVIEAEQGMRVEPGMVIIAAGGKHMVMRNTTAGVIIQTPDEPAETLHKPSVDVMFKSACQAFDGRVLSVIMTGMGKDGLEGVRLIKNSGGLSLIQDEETCVVYGMPKAVADANLADAILPLDRIAGAITKAVSAKAEYVGAR